MDRLLPGFKVGKARRPKFELHLKIYDLNNVPLVSGHSFIKWHLAHSMHAEHRGRTSKCPIANHRVDYNFCTLVPSIRINIERNNNLAECPIDFEIIQEFAVTEKITLGTVRLNLSEYVEESEAFSKEVSSPGRMRSSSITVSPTNTARARRDSDVIEDGIIRRYLIQDAKVNSTLKIGILMVQVDGERSFIAPPLKTAPVFGGIAGIMAGETVEDDTGPVPSISKPRDAADLQDLYRRTLSASWCRQPHELPADECIEDIFNGGNGWKTKPHSDHHSSPTDAEDSDSDADHPSGTLRPSDFRRLHAAHPPPQAAAHHHHTHHPPPSRPLHHRRSPSGGSDKSVSTVTVTPGNTRKGVRINDLDHSRSLASLTSSMSLDSEGLREMGYKRSREIGEFELRNDLVAWRLPSDGLIM